MNYRLRKVIYLIFKSNKAFLLFRIYKIQTIYMTPGAPDLILLILVFVILQSWWIIPIIKNNTKIYKRGEKLREEIKQLEKLYKK